MGDSPFAGFAEMVILESFLPHHIIIFGFSFRYMIYVQSMGMQTHPQCVQSPANSHRKWDVFFFNQQFLFLQLLTIAGQGNLKKSCDCCIRHRKKQLVENIGTINSIEHVYRIQYNILFLKNPFKFFNQKQR